MVIDNDNDMIRIMIKATGSYNFINNSNDIQKDNTNTINDNTNRLIMLYMINEHDKKKLREIYRKMKTKTITATKKMRMASVPTWRL